MEVKWRFSGGMKRNYYAIYQNVNQYLVEVDRNKVLNSMKHPILLLGTRYLSSKFSREFRTLLRPDSDFAGTKLRVCYLQTLGKQPF